MGLASGKHCSLYQYSCGTSIGFCVFRGDFYVGFCFQKGCSVGFLCFQKGCFVGFCIFRRDVLLDFVFRRDVLLDFVFSEGLFCGILCFQKGCSVRFLNPQTYSRNMWKILSVLQEFFNCSVGANVWVTASFLACVLVHCSNFAWFRL